MLSLGTLLFLQATLPAGVTMDMLVVFLVILGAIVLFVTEWIPIDVTAIAIMVTLIVLEPWTQISPSEGISGFSSSATITVLAMLYVIETRFGSSGQLWNLLDQQAKTVSREVRAQGAQAGIDVTTVTREGVPEREIRDLAEENDIDLIVLGTHGQEGIDRFVMGSVAASVLRNASRPVLTVRSNSSD